MGVVGVGSDFLVVEVDGLGSSLGVLCEPRPPFRLRGLLSGEAGSDEGLGSSLTEDEGIGSSLTEEEGIGSSLIVDDGTLLLLLGLQRSVPARLRTILLAGTDMSRAAIWTGAASGWAARAAISLWLWRLRAI